MLIPIIIQQPLIRSGHVIKVQLDTIVRILLIIQYSIFIIFVINFPMVCQNLRRFMPLHNLGLRCSNCVFIFLRLPFHSLVDLIQATDSSLVLHNLELVRHSLFNASATFEKFLLVLSTRHPSCNVKGICIKLVV